MFCSFAALGCDGRRLPDALGLAADAAALGSVRLLFPVIDEAARDALVSVFLDRKKAAAAIEAFYPASLRARAIDAFGLPAEIDSAHDYFAFRCDKACFHALTAPLGYPAEVEEGERGIWLVRSARGTLLAMRRGRAGYYGLDWHAEALSRERSHANQALKLIQVNTQIYRRKARLEAGLAKMLAELPQGGGEATKADGPSRALPKD